MSTCPHCNGKGTNFCHVNRGNKPHTWEHLTCFTCGGSGEITQEQADWIEEGKKIKEYRLSKDYSLREFCAVIGYSAVTLSRFESGKQPLEDAEIRRLIGLSV